MKRVAECVYRRGNHYYVAISDSAAPSGKRAVGTFRTQAEAIRARDRARAERAERHGATRVGAMVERWLRDGSRRWEPSTAVHNAERIRAFDRDFGPRWLDSISPSEALDWSHAHRGNVPVVRAMFNHAGRLGLAGRNPFAELRLDQSRGRRDLIPITEGELHELADKALAIHGPDFGPIFRAAVLFLAYVGCRPGELRAVTWADLDVSKSEVRISRQRRTDGIAAPKNKRARTVVLPAPAVDALLSMHRRMGVPWVFTSVTGKQLSQGTFRYAWVPVAAAAGRSDMDPYELRHFCGSHLADRGLTGQDIAHQLGHTDGGKLAQELYIHIYEDRAKERIKRAFGSNVRELRGAGQGAHQEQGGSSRA